MARFIVNRNVLKEQYQSLVDLGFLTAYSVKTNPDVVPFLEEDTNCLFSIVAGESADHVKDKSRLWFIAQAWDGQEILELLERGITKFVVDNECDLLTLKKALVKTEQSIDLQLRMKIREHTIYTGKHYVFGMSSEMINEEIAQLKNHPKINSLGVHFYRKTQNVSEWNFIDELERALTKETLKTIDSLNIGGGLPVKYANSNIDVLPSIFEKLKALVMWCKEQNITPMMEPGRYIVAPAVKLEAKIIAKYENTLILDCSIFNGALDTALLGLRLLVEGEGEGEEYLIKGRTPDSTDIFRYKVKLPRKEVGDTIVFLNAGAYTFTTDFCGLKKITLETQTP
ncbi:decarboxylase [Candidatus Woesearchaeota archaeon]|nr:MAG: decarboxylase [Candidatus Woesearchaeota archaeon]